MSGDEQNRLRNVDEIPPDIIDVIFEVNHARQGRTDEQVRYTLYADSGQGLDEMVTIAQQELTKRTSGRVGKRTFSVEFTVVPR